MTQPAIRLITLIMLLQSHPHQRAADLAKELGVSVRTLHRYFAMLDELGIPWYAERGPHGGFSLVRGYKMPPLVLTPEEATAVYLGAGLVDEVWGSIYAQAARGALAKLDNVLPDEQRAEIAWAQRSLVTTGLHRNDMTALTPVLEQLRRAVRDRQRVNMVYRSGSHPEPHPRELDPYALVHRWGWWYLVGHCHLHHEVRLFRVDRILELALTEQSFQIPPDFDVRAFLKAELQFQAALRVRMRFSPEGASVAHLNRAYWETLEEQPDGSVLVTFLTPDLIWAASNALSYGLLVTVLEPDELRTLVHDQAQAIVQRYQA
ncbi:MAG: YafY family protein [Anaerolineaceae bacterium]|nr:YafY family protein [Anaerolineaceae bacterium]